MLDIHLFRNNSDAIKESQKRRFKDEKIVDLICELDSSWRKKLFDINLKKKEANSISRKIGKLYSQLKKGDDSENIKQEINDLKELKSNLDEGMENLNKDLKELKSKLDSLLYSVGNIVHTSVPISDSETDNKIIRIWGNTEPLPEWGKPHHELLQMIDGFDAKRGVKLMGHRGYFLKGWGMRLQMALVNYAVDFLINKNFIPMQTPYMMYKEIMAETAELSQFQETLYEVKGGEKDDEKCGEKDGEKGGDNSKYLIATSEQPLSAYHRGENIEEKELPIKYCGHSMCFRKEAGSHGKENWGIFRVHQFEKVEQFVLSNQENSYKILEEMIENSEEFLQTLGIPYRTVAIVSGALNKAAAKKYDIEAWFPGYNEYKEVVSCSNCTDYQARRMDIKLGYNQKNKTKEFVHMLNGTLCATTRCICVILENHQEKDGIRIPKVLLPYFRLSDEDDFIKFIN